jgi:hypothetical protein
MSIDTNNPEQYEVSFDGDWLPVVSIFDAGTGSPEHCRYGVIFENNHGRNGYSCTWTGENMLRDRKVWTPTPGKLYMYSDCKEDIGGSLGSVRRAWKEPIYDSRYVAETRGNADNETTWKYCWPIPKSVYEEAGE